MAGRVWPVFVVYVLAFVAIIAFTIVAAVALRALYPDLAEAELFSGLHGLLAGGVASSVALGVTVLSVSRPLDATRLRLRPGRETGRDLVAIVVGTLTLGQTLDSLTMLASLGQRGSMAVIRQALQGAGGSDLFAAVLVIGIMAGAAEEVFFRGYMQTRLREAWGPVQAIGVTALAFALLHLEWLHALLALLLGLWLGFVTERMGSALPSVAAHVINNTVFTVLTATLGSVTAFGPNVALAVGSATIFAVCVAFLARRAGPVGP
jgi:hypothetical protein